MNDFRDLKSIAEACQQHQPLRFMPSHGELYIRNDNGIVFDVHQNRSFPEFMAQNKDYADLVLAANPVTVLTLIAEVERLRTAEGDAMTYKAGMENVAQQRDQLKAEIAGLNTGFEAYEQVNAGLKAEVEALRKDAERYRWLRIADWWRSPVCVIRNPKEQAKLGSDCPSGDRLDAAIDAAMGKGEQS